MRSALYGTSPTTLSLLSKLVNHEDSEICMLAVESLVRKGKPVSKPSYKLLKKMLRDFDYSVQEKVIFWLAQSRDLAAIPDLIRQLKDNPDYLEIVTRGLKLTTKALDEKLMTVILKISSNKNDYAEIESLLKQRNSTLDTQWWLKLARTDSDEVQVEALRALEKVKHVELFSLTKKVFTESDSPLVVITGFDILRKLNTLSANDVLARALNDSRPTVRALAMDFIPQNSSDLLGKELTKALASWAKNSFSHDDLVNKLTGTKWSHIFKNNNHRSRNSCSALFTK